MKKVFSVIIIICAVVTFGFVSFNFFNDLDSANKIYSNVYAYTNNLNSQSLNEDLTHSATLTNSVIASELNEEQKEYLTELSKTINNLETFMEDISTNLVNKTKKNSKVSSIIKSINHLKELRSELLFELNVYSVKMSGNTIGDPVRTYTLLLEDVFNFTVETNSTFNLIHSYVSENELVNKTKLNVYEIYSSSINNLKANFDISTHTFNNNSFKTLKVLNNNIVLKNNNLKTDPSIIGGIYSNTALLFNNAYEKVDATTFISNFHLKSFNNININTEKDFENIAYYYFVKLLGVN